MINSFISRSHISIGSKFVYFYISSSRYLLSLMIWGLGDPMFNRIDYNLAIATWGYCRGVMVYIFHT